MELEKKSARILGTVPSVPKIQETKPIIEEKEPEQVTPKEQPK